MKHICKLLVGLTVALLVTVLLMAPALASGTFIPTERSVSGPALDGSAATGCTKMQAGPVIWLSLTEDGEVDQAVESYPSGTLTAVAAFKYNCVPKNTTIVTVWDLDGETVATKKEALRSSPKEDYYFALLATKDGSPLDDGEFTVSFYNNKTLLTSGKITVGGDKGMDASGGTVSVQGKITDKRTGRPIAGAVVIVLQPGSVISDWIDNDMPEDEVFDAARTDTQGQFALEQPLERNVPYPFVVVAKGYKPIMADEVIFDEEDPDPVVLNIQMTK